MSGSVRTAALESYSLTRADYVDSINHASNIRSGSPSLVSPIKNVPIENSSERMTEKMLNSLTKSDHLSVMSLGSI